MPRPSKPSHADDAGRPPGKAKKRRATNPAHDAAEAARVERNRVAQALHDTVCQELTAICLMASAAAYQCRSTDPKAEKMLEEISDMVQRTGANLAGFLLTLRQDE